MTPLSQLLRWRDLGGADRLSAVRDAINAGLIVAPTDGPLHVAIVRVLIDTARLRKLAKADRAALAAASAWADCPCEKHRERATAAWAAAATGAGAAGTAAGTAAWAAGTAAWAAGTAAWAAEGTAPAPAKLDAIVARRLPAPIVTINGAEYDLADDATRVALALAGGASGTTNKT